ncbi:centriolin isoform X1 [Lates japonicus]|uniref:Centriolin isoform X1 n=1 Tax=Lates japonicus TaxID=270547 RepID=A0AAD3RGT3_LATJO|nr:centriolin isoform X1 [Lates japonicus]
MEAAGGAESSLLSKLSVLEQLRDEADETRRQMDRQTEESRRTERDTEELETQLLTLDTSDPQHEISLTANQSVRCRVTGQPLSNGSELKLPPSLQREEGGVRGGRGLSFLKRRQPVAVVVSASSQIHHRQILHLIFLLLEEFPLHFAAESQSFIPVELEKPLNLDRN